MYSNARYRAQLLTKIFKFMDFITKTRVLEKHILKLKLLLGIILSGILAYYLCLMIDPMWSISLFVAVVFFLALLLHGIFKIATWLLYKGNQPSDTNQRRAYYQKKYDNIYTIWFGAICVLLCFSSTIYRHVWFLFSLFALLGIIVILRLRKGSEKTELDKVESMHIRDLSERITHTQDQKELDNAFSVLSATKTSNTVEKYRLFNIYYHRSFHEYPLPTMFVLSQAIDINYGMTDGVYNVIHVIKKHGARLLALQDKHEKYQKYLYQEILIIILEVAGRNLLFENDIIEKFLYDMYLANKKLFIAEISKVIRTSESVRTFFAKSSLFQEFEFDNDFAKKVTHVCSRSLYKYWNHGEQPYQLAISNGDINAFASHLSTTTFPNVDFYALRDLCGEALLLPIIYDENDEKTIFFSSNAISALMRSLNKIYSYVHDYDRKNDVVVLQGLMKRYVEQVNELYQPPLTGGRAKVKKAFLIKGLHQDLMQVAKDANLSKDMAEEMK